MSENLKRTVPVGLIVLCIVTEITISQIPLASATDKELQNLTADSFGIFNEKDYLPKGQNPTLLDGRGDEDDATKVPLILEHVLTVNPNRTFLGPNMVFLAHDDILILDDARGKVWRIVEGQISADPLIDLDAYSPDGLVGIASKKAGNGSIYVFLYLNEAPSVFGSDLNSSKQASMLNNSLGYDREGDRLYRYRFDGNKLVEPKLLLTVPDKTPNVFQEIHHGGEVLIGPDNNVYVVIGEIDGEEHDKGKTMAQNYQDGHEPDGRAGILRITQDGKIVNSEGILGTGHPLDMYYAYGIRNSFGMDFDPLTGNLWDTENGPDYGDEINLVEPGFNSGWNKVQGFWRNDEGKKGTLDTSPNNLVDFNGKGNYSAPEFVWNFTVGPTALKFFNSTQFGQEYENDIFAADINNGNIYHFDLNEDRTELALEGPLADKIANEREEIDDIIFAEGFNGIADLQVGPDGFLYIISNLSIFRIRPALDG
jgi:glucose/arabinose dehydrogenase